MKSAGIIVEYNPFHNGHLYHLQQSKKIAKADIVIAVMSGNFLQRGEPALVSKFSRAKMALENGVDIVVELPYAYCTQKAEIFALGAIQILNALKCNFLCFGSESGDISTFTHTISFLEENKDQYNYLVKQHMKEGLSYPKATSLAFQKIKNNTHLLDLAKPNNILGYHYIKALNDISSTIVPLTILRKNSGYHDENLSPSKISSATSIRHALFEMHSLEAIKDQVPIETYTELTRFKNDNKTFVHWENLWPFLKYRILHSNPEELQEIYEIEEGIENRMIRYAKTAISFKQFMEGIKTKRYTWTRLQRACVHILTNTKKAEMKQRMMQPEYIRLLGLSKNGRKYLKQIKEDVSIPIISKLSQANIQHINLDVKASQVYSFSFPMEVGQYIIEQELKQPPIIGIS